MGSSGMKRKGRKHLPKVGTRPANEHELHDRQQGALHPFSTDPYRRRGRSPVLTIVAMLIVVVAVLAIIAVTI
jgi:hypothetical protein